ncbi:hypothetical protein BS50DRAFT_55265 [Corynespora cassiicola Philippines]|uniref:Uncharacterized protein n=1 Tax=Corynespora cassiicola Philippines TaxID=1448308 RepID=A0A2T2NIP4_CORCC|nr:hypothetical protein BS50DRAFT_55265 [Corynespora cassiicola Philippines]
MLLFQHDAAASAPPLSHPRRACPRRSLGPCLVGARGRTQTSSQTRSLADGHTSTRAHEHTSGRADKQPEGLPDGCLCLPSPPLSPARRCPAVMYVTFAAETAGLVTRHRCRRLASSRIRYGQHRSDSTRTSTSTSTGSNLRWPSPSHPRPPSDAQSPCWAREPSCLALPPPPPPPLQRQPDGNLALLLWAFHWLLDATHQTQYSRLLRGLVEAWH